MSITREAAAIIDDLGAGTVDNVLPRMPGYTRTQVFRALKTAAYMGLIDTDGWTGPKHGGSTPTTYRRKKAHPRPRVSTVFDLAAMYQ